MPKVGLCRKHSVVKKLNVIYTFVNYKVVVTRENVCASGFNTGDDGDIYDSEYSTKLRNLPGKFGFPPLSSYVAIHIAFLQLMPIHLIDKCSCNC